MQCPKCHKEQQGTKFCTNCGANLAEVEEPADQMKEQPDLKQEENTNVTAEKDVAIEETESQEQTEEQADTPADRIQNNLEKQLIRKQMILSFTVPVLLGIFIIALSYGLSAAARKSSMIQDYVYLFFSSFRTLSNDLSFYLASQMKAGLWDALVLFHMGSMKGSIERISGSEQMVISDFSLYLPMLMLPIILVGLFVLSYRLVFRFVVLSRFGSISFLAVSGLIYAVLITGTMMIFPPSLEWVSENGAAAYQYEMNIHAVELFLKSFALHTVGGLFGFRLITLWTPVKKLLIFAGSLLILIGAMMITAWALSNPSAFAYAPSVTIASLWTEYKADFVFYLVFPTMIIQEMLYAIGGTWQISGNQIASWMQLRPMNMHLITGVHLPVADVDTAGTEWASQMAAFVRTTWHPYAILFVILYSLSQARAEGKWKSVFLLTFAWGAVCFVLAAGSTVRLTTGTGTEITGFSSLQVLIYAVGLGLLFFGIAYLLRMYWERRKGRLGIE